MDELAPRALARCAFFDKLDGKLSATGHAVPAPTPAPAPAPPALSFEAWAELSVRLADASPQERAAALAVRGLTALVWERLEGEYLHVLRDDVRAGKRERPALYEAMNKAEMARRAGPSAVGTPPVIPAPAALSGTDLAPDLGAAAWEGMARMPFVPPAPEQPSKGKRPAKTVPSKVVPSHVGGETMGLDPAHQRPTPTLPFEGSMGSMGVGYVEPLDARQYVALAAKLVLEPAQRLSTLGRYQVPTEAAFRAVEEHWRDPARRAELEGALSDFAATLRGRVLG
jgi:hypothetical protein